MAKGRRSDINLSELLPPEKLKAELEIMSAGEVAKKYNCTRPSVQRLKKKYGMTVKDRNVADEDKLRPKSELYRPLENLDLTFFHQEVSDFIEMWMAGIHIGDISAKMKRDEMELAVLVMDQAAKGKLKPRKNGAFGDLTYEADKNYCIFCEEEAEIFYRKKYVCKSCIDALREVG